MQKNLQGLRVGSQDDELCDTTVEGLRGLGADKNVKSRRVDPSALWHTFIGSFFELLELRRTLDEVEDLAGEEARRSQHQGGHGQNLGKRTELVRSAWARGNALLSEFSADIVCSF